MLTEDPSTSQGATPDESHPMEGVLADMVLPARGELREGTIASISSSAILVDVGAKTEGVITGQELASLDADVVRSLRVGQDLWVYVVNPEDREGNILLSISKAEELRDWQTAQDLHQSQKVYEGQIEGFNRGGLIVPLGQLRGFIPASQMSLARRRRSIGDTPSQKWGGMVGETVMVKVIEVDQRRNRLILSERAAAKESRAVLRERLLAELASDDVRTGRIISLADFGAFVDLGGAEGLVHLSELTWKHIDHPRDMFKVGQEVEVQVLNVDRERKRIALSIKRLQADPWERVAEQYQVGQLVEATITRLTKFGAFARLKSNEEIEGLVHISELSEQRIAHPKEVVREGDELTLRIVKISAERRRLGLSLKEVDSPRYAALDYEFYMAASDSADEPEVAEPETVEPETVEPETAERAATEGPTDSAQAPDAALGPAEPESAMLLDDTAEGEEPADRQQAAQAVGATAAETPAAETPAAETPAAETPAEEALGEEPPAEEAPAAETPAEEAPAAETPAEEALGEEPADLPAETPPAPFGSAAPLAESAAQITEPEDVDEQVAAERQEEFHDN